MRRDAARPARRQAVPLDDAPGVLLAGLASLVLAGGAHARAVPFGFLGVTADGPLTAGTPRAAEFADMQRHGVELLRIGIEWNVVEPAPGACCAGPAPTLVTAAAQHGMDVLPTISWTPRWAAAHPGACARRHPPTTPPTGASPNPRGCAGTDPAAPFWARALPKHQGTPDPHVAGLERAQPGRLYGWSDEPFAPGYVALLACRRAPPSRAVDPARADRARRSRGPLLAWHDLDTRSRRPRYAACSTWPTCTRSRSSPSGVLRIVRPAPPRHEPLTATATRRCRSPS